MSGELSHLDRQGRATMVDVSAKGETERTATARARIVMLAETLSKLADGTAPKGDVLAAARIAGIMAAKRTAELIPLCHPLALTSVAVELVANAAGPAVDIAATVKTKGPTGVEMEALTAAAVAALTIYDMLKSADRGMRIEGLRLTHKAGGKSGEFQAP